MYGSLPRSAPVHARHPSLVRRELAPHDHALLRAGVVESAKAKVSIWIIGPMRSVHCWTLSRGPQEFGYGLGKDTFDFDDTLIKFGTVCYCRVSKVTVCSVVPKVASLTHVRYNCNMYQNTSHPIIAIITDSHWQYGNELVYEYDGKWL